MLLVVIVGGNRIKSKEPEVDCYFYGFTELPCTSSALLSMMARSRWLAQGLLLLLRKPYPYIGYAAVAPCVREWLYMNIQALSSSSSSSPGPLFPRKSFSFVQFFCALLQACPINRLVPFNRRHVQKSTSSHPFMNQQSVFPVPVQRKIETRHRMIIRPDWPLAIPMNDIAHRLMAMTRTLAWRKLRISTRNWLITSAIRDSPFRAPYRHPNGISHMFFMLRMWLYVSHVCYDIPPCPVHQKVAVVWWRSKEKMKQKPFC